MSQSIAPAYLQNLASVEGSNEATNYQRVRDEIEKQRREAEEAKRKAGSFGARLGRGLTKGLGGALTGAATGFMAGGPAGALAGAGIGGGAGFLGGAADSGSGNPNIVSQMAPAMGALASAGMGRYLGGSGGGANPMTAAGLGGGISGNAFQDSVGAGGMTPEMYQIWMEQQTRGY